MINDGAHRAPRVQGLDPQPNEQFLFDFRFLSAGCFANLETETTYSNRYHFWYFGRCALFVWLFRSLMISKYSIQTIQDAN